MIAVSRPLTLAAIALVAAGAFYIGHRTATSSPAPLSSPNGALASSNISADTTPPIVDKTSASFIESERLRKLVTSASSSLRDEEQRQHLMDEWAAVDPRAAMEYARTQLSGDRQAQAVSAVLTMWGKNDPASAWNWVKKEMPNATNHFDTLLEVFGRNSPQVAAQYAAEFTSAHPEAALEVHMAALLGITYTGNFDAARALVANNPSLDAAARGTLNNFIAGQWGRFAPAAAADWVMTLPAGPERDQALVGLGESWSDVNPAQATNFAINLPAGDTRTLALRQAISKWVVTDPVAARNWVLNTDRHEDFDQAVQAVATETNLMSREPARAILWADGIFDNSIRQQTQNTILFNWYSSDPNAATSFIQSSTDFTAEQRADLLKKLRPAS